MWDNTSNLRIFNNLLFPNKSIEVEFNLNLLDHDTNKKVQDFLNLIYQNNLIPAINRPKRVTIKTATVINYILTNSFADTDFK